ncbi:MAG TPA: Trp family transcriptional regulator [Patescibacteria group bacterium]|nr:Trp family transcriptional regulator [Patescibacteria group bacterium]
MSQVSKYPLRPEIYEKLFDLLMTIFIKSFNKPTANSLLEELFTPSEKIMIAKRLGISVLLAKGYSYQVIQSILHVSKTTIATVSSSMKYGGKGYVSFTKSLLQEEQMEQFWTVVEQAVFKALSIRKGSGVWRTMLTESKKQQYRKAKLA